MDDSENETQITVRSNNDTGNQTTRSVERTCTQKHTIPILEKYDTTSVRLWWRRFVQLVKMTLEGRFLQFETRPRCVSRRCVIADPRNRKKLRIRGNNPNRTNNFKIFIRNWKRTVR